MDALKIRSIILDESLFKDLTKKEETLAVLPVGSLLRGNFIEGWSDIDLWIITKSINPNYLGTVAKFKEKIKQNTNTKTGIEIIEIDILNKFSSNLKLAPFFYKYLKNLWEGDNLIFKGMYYSRNQFVLPLYDIDLIRKVDLLAYILGIESAINIIFSDKSVFTQKKYILRKLIKNSLFLMQTSLIKQNKSGGIIHDFSEVLTEYQKNSQIDLNSLYQSFEKRFQWQEILDKNISDSEIQSAWNDFQKIKEATLKLC